MFKIRKNELCKPLRAQVLHHVVRVRVERNKLTRVTLFYAETKSTQHVILGARNLPHEARYKTSLSSHTEAQHNTVKLRQYHSTSKQRRAAA